MVPDLWTATQSQRFLGLEVGCRMTVVRLPNRELVLISPLPLKSGDRARLDALGTVKHLIAPNRFHHLYFGAAQALYPHAQAWGVEGLAQKRPDLRFDGVLDEPGNFAGALHYLPFSGLGSIMLQGIQLANETVFWHQLSQTLILTDLAFNFDETFPFTSRLAAQVLGSYQTLRPTRLEKWGSFDKEAVARSMRQVLHWEFDRVIPGHGSIVEHDAKAQLRAGFEWFLGRSLAVETSLATSRPA
ncbi:DUF4336 domain-containing protein [Leptolyngbya iicbica]|uniref:DUF4336 domain-containing protein n=1 Tax=Leptolyngbya iicbica TaxID=3161580 RepID=UPI001F5D8311|nr:DUF4336 domain-containing protein [Leptolyngbya sp. LK]